MVGHLQEFGPDHQIQESGLVMGRKCFINETTRNKRTRRSETDNSTEQIPTSAPSALTEVDDRGPTRLRSLRQSQRCPNDKSKRQKRKQGAPRVHKLKPAPQSELIFSYPPCHDPPYFFYQQLCSLTLAQIFKSGTNIYSFAQQILRGALKQ